MFKVRNNPYTTTDISGLLGTLQSADGDGVLRATNFSLGTGTIDTLNSNIYESKGIQVLLPETYDLLPVPTFYNGTQSTFNPGAAFTGFVGGVYDILRPCIYNSIIFQITTTSNVPTSIAIYQATGGVSASIGNPANLISYTNIPGTGVGVYGAISTGTNQLSPGVAYILYGKNSNGAGAYRTFAMSPLSIWNVTATLPTFPGYTGAPGSFTTNIYSGAPTDTFIPQNTTSVSTDVPLVVRLANLS